MFQVNDRGDIAAVAKSANMPFRKGSAAMGQKTQKRNVATAMASDGVGVGVASNNKVRSQSTLKN